MTSSALVVPPHLLPERGRLALAPVRKDHEARNATTALGLIGGGAALSSTGSYRQARVLAQLGRARERIAATSPGPVGAHANPASARSAAKLRRKALVTERLAGPRMAAARRIKLTGAAGVVGGGLLLARSAKDALTRRSSDVYYGKAWTPGREEALLRVIRRANARGGPLTRAERYASARMQASARNVSGIKAKPEHGSYMSRAKAAAKRAGAVPDEKNRLGR